MIGAAHTSTLGDLEAARRAQLAADGTEDVNEVRYPSGAVGCVSRQMLNRETGKADRKWRIACDPRSGDHTYPNRDAAALAEWHLAQADGQS